MDVSGVRERAVKVPGPVMLALHAPAPPREPQRQHPSPRTAAGSPLAATLPAQNNVILQRHYELMNAYQQQLQGELQGEGSAGAGGGDAPQLLPPLPPERDMARFEIWREEIEALLQRRQDS